MHDDWTGRDVLVQGRHLSMFLLVGLPLAVLGATLLVLAMDAVPARTGIVLMAIGTLGVLNAAFWLPRVKERFRRDAMGVFRVFPLPLAEAMSRLGELEVEQLEDGVPDGREASYRARPAGTTVRLAQHSETSPAVEVRPPDEDTDLGGLLGRLDRALTEGE